MYAPGVFGPESKILSKMADLSNPLRLFRERFKDMQVQNLFTTPLVSHTVWRQCFSHEVYIRRVGKTVHVVSISQRPMPKLKQSWDRSQHPRTQWNPRGMQQMKQRWRKYMKKLFYSSLFPLWLQSKTKNINYELQILYLHTLRTITMYI